MNKNIFLLLIIIIFLILESCIFDGDHLGNGYLYFYEQDYRKEDCILKKTSKNGVNDIIIFPTVILLKYDNDFILALQERTIEANEIFKDYDLYIEQTINKYQLWIINKKNDSIIGPLNYEEYNKKLKELNICTKIYLKIPTNIKDSLNY